MSKCPVDVGDRFSVSREISRTIYDAFIVCSGDVNPLHYDDAYARSLGFPSRLMHGAMLNAIISGFVGTGLPSKDTMCLSQSVKFKRPFFCEDVVQMRAQVSDVQESTTVDKWIVAIKLWFYVNDTLISTGEVELLMGL